MKKILKHKIDYKKVADGLGISEDRAKRFIDDGRVITKEEESSIVQN